MLNKNLSSFAVWLCISALYFFANGYLFYVCFVVKNNAVQYRLFNLGDSVPSVLSEKLYITQSNNTYKA